MISRYFVLAHGTFTSSTSGGPSFVKIERICDIIRPVLRSASMELSLIKTVSVKLEIIVQNKGNVSFFLLF
jgi:hypothetical protein